MMAVARGPVVGRRCEFDARQLTDTDLSFSSTDIVDPFDFTSLSSRPTSAQKKARSQHMD